MTTPQADIDLLNLIHELSAEPFTQDAAVMCMEALARYREQTRLSTEAAIVAWLREKEGAWRWLTSGFPDIGAPHVPRVLADAIEQEKHRG